MAKTEAELKALLTRGREAFCGADFEGSVKHFEEFVANEPGFADVFNMLGQAYHNMGKMEKAVQAYKKALNLNPRYTEVAINLAVALFDTGRYDEAQGIQKLIQTDIEKRADHLDTYAMKKLANMHMEIGDAYHALGLHDQSIEEYVKALHLAPQFPDVRTKLAESYRDKGMLDEAIHELEQLRDAQPNYIHARISLGISYYKKGKTPEAIREWKEILKLDPQNKAATAYLKLIPSD
jgi:tetratricopeptide (TPR) repeat protein